MLAACEAGELLALLEGGAEGARDAVDTLVALYHSVREPWLVRALLHYHARTASQRVIELLSRAPDPHSRYLLDALCEQLRADPPSRRAALAVLLPLVARRPSWLHRLPPHPPHPLLRDLLRAVKLEREPLPLLHALLTLAMLLAAAPALAAPHWPDLADALLRPAALEPPPNAGARAHLELAQLALFHSLYATHPCTLIETLRAELSTAASRDAWERSLQPLLHTVRLHPGLITGSRQREAEAARRLEEHDVVAETRRLTLYTPERRDGSAVPSLPSLPTTPAPGGAPAFRAVAALRPGTEPWFGLTDRLGAESAPHTPLPADPDAAEPPEAAVEATPENTPAKLETRAAFRFPSDSSAIRSIGRRKETSPPIALVGEAYSRLARVVSERRAADSPVPFAGAPPPAGAVRPEPRAPLVLEAEPFNVEDREVLELTARGSTDDPWSEGEGATVAERVAQMDPRKGETSRRSLTRSTGAVPRRSNSCGTSGERSVSVAVQTVDTWPQPYEFQIADFYRRLPEYVHKQETIREPTHPTERLDSYLTDLYNGKAKTSHSELCEQVSLLQAQLIYERWRREAHAERNRRLLGRCRLTHQTQHYNQALRDRLRSANREIEDLRARLASERASNDRPSQAVLDREQRLEAALQEERRLRANAEAALHEAEALRTRDAAALARTRGQSFEASRQVDALARAALAAERRAEHVRRLRRELLVLAEREQRLTASVRANRKCTATTEERVIKAAQARAEAEATAALKVAEAATARAHELEAALATRDAIITELKRATRHGAEEHAAKIRALEDKYQAAMKIVHAVEMKQLEQLAKAPLPNPRMRPVMLDDDEVDPGLDSLDS